MCYRLADYGRMWTVRLWAANSKKREYVVPFENGPLGRADPAVADAARA
jgi:hypothetical protein